MSGGAGRQEECASLPAGRIYRFESHRHIKKWAHLNETHLCRMACHGAQVASQRSPIPRGKGYYSIKKQEE